MEWNEHTNGMGKKIYTLLVWLLTSVLYPCVVPYSEHSNCSNGILDNFVSVRIRWSCWISHFYLTERPCHAVYTRIKVWQELEKMTLPSYPLSTVVLFFSIVVFQQTGKWEACYKTVKIQQKKLKVVIRLLLHEHFFLIPNVVVNSDPKLLAITSQHKCRSVQQEVGAAYQVIKKREKFQWLQLCLCYSTFFPLFDAWCWIT